MTHYYYVLLLGRCEKRGGFDGFEEPVETAVIPFGFSIAGCCDYADFGIVAHEV